jgi:hypothetical protein
MTMRSARPSALALASAAAFLLASATAAEEIVLRPRYEAGDSYRLSLVVTTDTEANSAGEAGESFEENVRLHYQASVGVLEVDGGGRPLRERHQQVSLVFERPGEKGSLFAENVDYEVERKEGLAILVGGQRVDPKLERTVADVLEKQFEYTLEPAFLQPDGRVKVGESWQPDASLASRFLLSRGIRVIEFGQGGSARLERRELADGKEQLVIEYSIPIARFELTRMPPRAEAARSEARLEGRIHLASDPRRGAISSFSNLTLDLSGVSRGPTQSLPWSLRSVVTVLRSSPGRTHSVTSRGDRTDARRAREALAGTSRTGLR